MARRNNSKNTARIRTKPSWGQRITTFFGVLTLIFMLGVLSVVGYVDFLFYKTARDLPTSDKLIDYVPGGITEIYATDKDPKTGKNVLLGKFYVQNKQFASIKEIPEALRNATVAIEDERFFTHPGVDIRAITRAVFRDLRGGRIEEGGSTLTQQLAKNIYLTRQRSMNRKAKEIMLAIQLEKNFSKEQILEMYLNEVYYGANSYGVQAAAQTFFGKKLGQLTVAQCALIAGLPQRPNDLQPFANVDASRERRDLVLGKMRELGYIDDAQYKKSLKEPIKVVAAVPHNQSDIKAPYFVEYVIKRLLEKYGYDVVYKSGIKVYTTLNWKMQQEAEGALLNGVMDARGNRVTQGALVCVEPRTGYIRAMVGGVDFKKNQFNNAAQGRRQPGSSFKPFVYTTAFETRKWSDDSEVTDEPTAFPDGGGKFYRPKNFGGSYHGRVTIREAVIHSYNIPAVYMCSRVGPKNVITTARKMGITADLKPTLAIALGAYEVSPLEMASAYSTFPNSGSHARSMAIIRVLDRDGGVLENNAPNVDRAVISESACGTMSDILGDVVARGTASGAKGIHEVENAHGKTGTTNDHRDAWFVGYTPELSTAVWVCGVKTTPKGTIYQEMDETGGSVCAPIWARFMKAAVGIQRTSGEPINPLPRRPENMMPAVPEANKKGDDTKSATKPTADAAVNNKPTPIVAAPINAPVLSGLSPARTATAIRDTSTAVKTNTEAGSTAAVAITPRTASNSRPTAAPQIAPIERPTSVAEERPAPVRRTPVYETPPPPREIEVELCADTGLRATRWCPETIKRRFAVGSAPRRYCKLHRPAPGEGN